MNKALSKILLSITLLWTACFTILYFLRPFSLTHLITASDVYQLILGLAAAVILLASIKKRAGSYIVLGTSLAVFSWTMGQLFWFSYTLLSGVELPYPSVGDLGYTGAYFLLIGVLALIRRKHMQGNTRELMQLPAREHTVKTSGYSGYSDYLPLALLVLPAALYLLGQRSWPELLYNVVDCTTIAWALFRAFSLRRVRRYRWFLLGIVLLALTDLIFIFGALLFPERASLTSAPLYPLALSLITFGILHGEGGEDG